jgi:hypothetical protein
MKFALSLILTLFIAATAGAAVEGTVVNKTTGKPQSGVQVTLMRLGSGMDNVGSAASGEGGKFTIAADLQPGAPHLLQAAYQQVNYNKMIPPGSPVAGITLEIFDASPQPGAARVAQHMILLEPTGNEVNVSESIVYTNQSTTTWNDPKAGTLRFYLPPEAKGQVNVNVISGKQGMPLQRPAEKGTGNSYFVRAPVKPGETRFDLSYTLPGVAAFASKILHGGGPVRLVAPQGVKLLGDALTNLGPEPRTQATVYEVRGDEYKVAIEGTGSLRASAASQENEEESGPKVAQKKPRIYDRLPVLLTLVGLMMSIGFVLLYRLQTPNDHTRPAGK